ncbi:hypothetical protein AB1L88_16745 [Tautonia sp. JC769]|uniref:hypothetical protein n=1 Tax=Tautonia sp. JC769 TaxID=3232135 RepID=UPI003457B756
MSANRRRAMRIGHILDRNADGQTGREGLIDLLADARHWCDRHGESYARLDRLAHEHYLAEQQAGLEAIEPVEDEASLNVHGLLERGRQIAVVWSVEDVLQVRPDLSPEQAWDVLVSCRRRHDATIGINWDVLEVAAGCLYPEPQSNHEQGESHE